MNIFLTIVISYLLGSCSTGILLSKLSKQGDIRTKGSGNSGATNMLRVMGKKYAILTLLGDMLKGALAALLGKWLVGGAFGGMLGAVFAVIGHNFPVFFGFKGGKGIATSFGAVLCVLPIQILIAFAVFVITVAITRYVSLGSILAAVAFPLAVFLSMPGDLPVVLLAVFMGALAIWRHRANISRLLSHKESKISFKK